MSILIRPVLTRATCALAMLVVVAGCARSVTNSPDEPSNLEAWVAEVNNRPPPPLEPLPVMQQFETFEYSAQSLRDPFSRAFRDEDTGNGLRPDSNRAKQKLEEFPLDTMKMVGTLGTGRGMLALVTAPDKVTYRVRAGVYMGQNDGRVTGIGVDRIDLVELVSDGAGGWLERPASIALDDK